MSKVVQVYEAIMWSMVALTLILILLRTWVRTVRSSDKLSGIRPSDVFALLAWVSFLIESSLGTHLGDESKRIYNLPYAINDYKILLYVSDRRALRFIYVLNVWYANCMYAVKGSIIGIYYEILPRGDHWRKTRITLRVIAWSTGISWAILVGVRLYAYRVFLNNCVGDDPLRYDACIDSYEFLPAFFIYYVLHPITDILIYAFPIPTLYNHFYRHRASILSTPQKFGLAFSFGAGFLCIAIVFLALIIQYKYDSEGMQDNTYMIVLYYFWTLEQTYALLVVCGPATVGLLFSAWGCLRNGRSQETGTVPLEEIEGVSSEVHRVETFKS